MIPTGVNSSLSHALLAEGEHGQPRRGLGDLKGCLTRRDFDSDFISSNLSQKHPSVRGMHLQRSQHTDEAVHPQDAAMEVQTAPVTEAQSHTDTDKSIDWHSVPKSVP